VDRDCHAGWDVARPSGEAPLGGVAVIGYRDRGAAGLDIPVVAIPAVTVVIGFGGNDLIVDGAAGRQAFTGFVTGFPRGSMRIRSEQAECVEVRVSPLRVRSLLGVAPAELGCVVLDLDGIWGRRAQSLRQRLAAAATWQERFAVTRSFLAQHDEPARAPDPEVVASWDRLLASRGRVRIDELAHASGWSRKRLLSRFESQIGLTPKRAAMLVRFRHAVEGLMAGRAAADVAADCGYTDQSHLSRDVSSFADTTPGTLAGQPLSEISKLRYQTWGTFFQYRRRPLVR
jgi:AraC-like DNA-binding protein